MAKICIIGAGKIGRIVNAFLKLEKHEVFLVDSNTEIENAIHIDANDENAISDFIKDKASEIFEKIKGFFSFDLPTIEFPELPDIGTIVKSFAAGLLPDPESYAGKTLYYFKPELLDLKKSLRKELYMKI